MDGDRRMSKRKEANVSSNACTLYFLIFFNSWEFRALENERRQDHVGRTLEVTVGGGRWAVRRCSVGG